MGTNVVCDLFASTTDLIGECARVYESKLAATREAAMNQVTKRYGRQPPMLLLVLILIMER